MALTFNTPLVTPQGFEVANAYGRVSVLDDKTGTLVQAGLAIYASEEAFTSGKEEIGFPNLGFATAPYDRATDGTDILNIAHDLLIAELAKGGITATKNL